MDESQRRERLDQLLDLAQAYRAWNRKQLAQALHRDASNLSPTSGLPKLDFIVELARVLEWSVENVVKSIWLEEVDTPLTASCEMPDDFAVLETSSRDASRAGRHNEAVGLAQHAFRMATTGEERAIASVREACAWDGLGRYENAMIASKRGLAQEGVPVQRRRLLQNNLANEYYSLWQPLEARGLAHDLIDFYDRHLPRCRLSRVSQAFAYYVRGNSSRRLCSIDSDQSQQHAQVARTDLRTAERLLSELASDFRDQSYEGVAHTCRGGIIETEVTLKQRDPEGAIAEISDGLSAVVDLSNCTYGDWLESYGWWCVYGCNVAVRHVRNHASLQQHLAVFTNKADEIAERTNNWAVRERLVTMEYVRRRQFQEWTGVETDWTIDSDDIRAIAGTMGRFPSFHETGWKILRSARIVKD